MLKKILVLSQVLITLIIQNTLGQDISSTYPIVLPQLNNNSFVVQSGSTVNIISSQSVTLLSGTILQNGSNVSIRIGTPPGFVGTPLLRSYVQQDVIKVAGITTDDQVYNLNAFQKQTTKTFIDGFDRVVQTIAVKASPLQHDIVQAFDYNSLGQQTAGYLPYTGSDGSGNFRSSALNEQAAFYSNGTTDKIVDDPSPFAQQVFENSPLQRVLQMGSAGTGFQPGQHFKVFGYRSNSTGDNVIKWGDNGTYQGVYTANALEAKEATDEQGLKIILFTDLDGHLILKRQLANETINGNTVTYFDTYYVYNNAGLVSYVIPPKAVSAMASGANWDITQQSVNALLFKFVYDNRGNVIEKALPGNITLNVVFDPLNRPVLIQDGNLKANHQWNYVKYDAKGRAISQGVYTNNTYLTRVSMQQYVNGLNYDNYFEDRSANTATGNYTNNVFPVSDITDLAYAYYDDYDINNDGNADYTYQAQGLSNEATPTIATRGMLTVVKKKTVGQGITATWLYNVLFYTDKGELIQALGNNLLNTALNDVRTSVPDFTGKPVQVKVIKNAGATTVTVSTNFTYDHTNRLLAIDQSYNGANPVRTAAYTYNEIGQLVAKNLHSTNGGSNFLQTLDYRFNIRGQLTSINNSTLTNDGIKNNDSNDIFGMEILYDQTDNLLGNAGYFNGNISAVKWMTKNGLGQATAERSYIYQYDQLNRLKNAVYADRQSSTWANIGGFDEKNIKYDENSNIIALQRNAIINGTITAIDDLQYDYIGNQLNNVSDGNAGNYTALGFKNLTGSTGVYQYDDNGNLKTDPKKGISLTYNTLNRTDKITINTATGRYITYTYDASAVLLRKQQFDNNQLQKTTDYTDGFIFENNILVSFNMPEGRVRNVNGVLKPEYVITDNMGNARVSFEEQNGQAAVKQENSYYPFGLVMNGSNVPTPSQPNKNLYNAGAEWQNDYADLPDYYQTYYRNYDAALGRFVGIDPQATLYESFSPYQYALNNPLSNNDPLGDRTMAEWQGIIDQLLSSQYGGYADNTSVREFDSALDAIQSFYMGGGDGGGGGGGGAVPYGVAAATFNAGVASGAKGYGTQYANTTPQYIYLMTHPVVITPNMSDAQILNAIHGAADAAFNQYLGNGIKDGQQGTIQASLFPKVFDKGNALLNAGSTLVGAGEIGLKLLRSNSELPKNIARIITSLSGKFVGTQKVAGFLRTSASQMSKTGRYLGNIGILVSTVDYVANFKEKSGYDHVSYWAGMGVSVISTAFPVVGLIYGGIELGSYLYNGKSAEENIGKALGY
jgi:RHS repeat-associated protein